jgi:hypothetical protein
VDEFSDLDDIHNIDLTISGNCQLCEELFYDKTIFHLCADHTDEFGRRDLFQCKCGYLKYLEDHKEVELPYGLKCECDE